MNFHNDQMSFLEGRRCTTCHQPKRRRAAHELGRNPSILVGARLLRAAETTIEEHATYLNAKHVARQLGVSERTVTRLLRAGHLPAFRLGTKLWRTTQTAVDEYVKEGQYGRYRRHLPVRRRD